MYVSVKWFRCLFLFIGLSFCFVNYRIVLYDQNNGWKKEIIRTLQSNIQILITYITYDAKNYRFDL